MDDQTRLPECSTDTDTKRLQKLPSMLSREASMNKDGRESGFPSDYSDLDLSFTSYTATTTTASARSSLSFPEPRLSAAAGGAHRRADPLWSAVDAASAIDGGLQLGHLRLLRRLGSGNLGMVFHCQLKGFDGADFALKVVDRSAASGRKLAQAAMEAEVVAALDHPFLPTLYARFEASHYSCLLIDYCAGGDLHALLRSHPRGGRLSPAAARFYAAEVLVALEYLHAAGVVYRDLKPENVLLRADGHVMLSDFDLCFRADVEPSVEFREIRRRRRRVEAEFAAEPAGARSTACVGTHEYLAPEVVAGGGHGGEVDWWAFGVFVYELLYGRTPFKGGSKEATLKNIAAGGVRFPEETAAMPAGEEEEMADARDLIRRLLVRDPRRRLGAGRGAPAIKRHPFFAGIDWPLIRCYRPPVVFRTSSSSAAAARGAEIGLWAERRLRRGGWRRWWCFGNKGCKLGLSRKRRKSGKFFIL